MTRTKFYDSLWKVSDYTFKETVFSLNPQYPEHERLARKKLAQTIEELMAEFDAKTARIVELENEIELMRYTWPIINQTASTSTGT